MTTTAIASVKAEMEVKSDVIDTKGNVLLKKGSILSEVWIERLKKRGISSIDVAGGSEGSPEASEELQDSKDSSKPYENLQEHMKLIFSPVLPQPHMKALARATYQFFKNKN
jgi:hypothetical protein